MTAGPLANDGDRRRPGHAGQLGRVGLGRTGQVALDEPPLPHREQALRERDLATGHRSRCARCPRGRSPGPPRAPRPRSGARCVWRTPRTWPRRHAIDRRSPAARGSRRSGERYRSACNRGRWPGSWLAPSVAFLRARGEPAGAHPENQGLAPAMPPACRVSLSSFREIIAWSAEDGGLRKLPIDDPMIAQPDGLALDDQRVARVERARPGLPVAGERPLAGGRVHRVLEGPRQLGHEAERGLVALARASERRRLLGDDLLLGALERLLALAHAGPSTTPAAISSAMRSSL